MKKFLLAAFLSCTLLSTQSNAGLYTGLGIGAAFNDGSQTTKDFRSSFKNSPAYSLTVGYKLPLLLTDVRVEGEYLRMKPEIKNSGHATIDAFLVNGYANVPLAPLPLIDPYVGLGLGLTRFEHENSPVYQLMLGAEYELPFMPATIGAEYRYFKITQDGGGRGEISKLHSNILMMKFRYEF